MQATQSRQAAIGIGVGVLMNFARSLGVLITGVWRRSCERMRQLRQLRIVPVLFHKLLQSLRSAFVEARAHTAAATAANVRPPGLCRLLLGKDWGIFRDARGHHGLMDCQPRKTRSNQQAEHGTERCMTCKSRAIFQISLRLPICLSAGGSKPHAAACLGDHDMKSALPSCILVLMPPQARLGTGRSPVTVRSGPCSQPCA